MNTISKILMSGVLAMALLPVVAQPPLPEGQPDAVAGATMPVPEHPFDAPHHGGCMMHGGGQAVNFQSVKIAYSPLLDAFVAVDSVECSIHLIRMTECGRMDTVASYKTDSTYKVHDLKSIKRPISVGFMGEHVVLVASAVKDTAYVALLDAQLRPVARHDFSSPMYAMHIEPGRMMVVGRNPYGYDIAIIPMKDGIESFGNSKPAVFHYRVAKQAEKIKSSDPVGIGLTAVAVSVVFLALVFIALILSGSAKLIMGAEKRKENKQKKPKKGITPVAEGSSASTEEEVYAAIAAAIHLYNDELHDEEEGIITIQKVEREWTPWNAKYYNMNHYFNNRK